MHIGLSAYATDAQGQYMPAASVTNLGLEIIKIGSVYDTRDQLLEYIPSPETFYCPDGSVGPDQIHGAVWGGWNTSRHALWISYAILAGSGDPTLPRGLTLDRPQTRVLGDAAWFRSEIVWVKEETDVVQPSDAPFLADMMRASSTTQPSDPGVFQHNHSGYITPDTSPIALQVDASEGFMGGNTIYFDGHCSWKDQKSMSEVTGPDNDDSVVSLGNTYYAF